MKQNLNIILIIFTILLLQSCETNGDDKLNIKSLFIGNGYLNIYESVNESQKSPIFLDEFDNNSNSWFQSTTSPFYIKIENGLFNLKNNTTSNFAVVQNNIQNLNLINFEYEVKMKITNNSNSAKLNSCNIGYTDAYMFTVDPNVSNKCILKNGIANTLSSHQTRKESNIISNEYNIYTIRKIENEVSFFINGNLISTSNYQNTDNKISFLFSNELLVDYIRIHKLNL